MLNSLHIGLDERFPGAEQLNFMASRDFARFWELPEYPRQWPYFFAAILEGCGNWSMLFMLPRFGDWPARSMNLEWDKVVEHCVLRGAEVPPGWSGAIGYDRSEIGQVLTILVIESLFPGCIGDDLYVVPDRGEFLIQTDHHGVVHIRASDKERLDKFVAHMNGAGVPLPTSLPDGTFKPPAWMEGGKHNDTGA